MRFLPYNREQAYLLPPSVKDVLGEDHLCFFLHRLEEKLDLSGLEADYQEEGRARLRPGDDGEAVAICLRVRGDVVAAAGAGPQSALS